jgi:hypothetical protein
MFQLSAKLRSKHEAAAVDPPATYRKEENDYKPPSITCDVQRIDTKDDERVES